MNIWKQGASALSVGIVIILIVFCAIYLWKSTHDN